VAAGMAKDYLSKQLTTIALILKDTKTNWGPQRNDLLGSIDYS